MTVFYITLIIAVCGYIFEIGWVVLLSIVLALVGLRATVLNESKKGISLYVVALLFSIACGVMSPPDSRKVDKIIKAMEEKTNALKQQIASSSEKPPPQKPSTAPANDYEWLNSTNEKVARMPCFRGGEILFRRGTAKKILKICPSTAPITVSNYSTRAFFHQSWHGSKLLGLSSEERLVKTTRSPRKNFLITPDIQKLRKSRNGFVIYIADTIDINRIR